LDGTTDDYYTIVLNFGLLITFGVTFSGFMWISFIMIIFEINIDKYKLMNLYRRPFPVKAANIGNWFKMMQLI